MNITAILIGAGIVGVLGLFVGVFLGFSEKIFKVEVNETEERVLECLPSNNCGGCGFASCAALAKEIAAGNAPVNACIVGGNQVSAQIAEILGKEALEAVRFVAHVKCHGSCDVAGRVTDYSGIRDCRYAVLAPGASGKGCLYGCMGLGSCVQVCDNEAISVVNGIAVVNEEKCFGCGECARACPKGLIEVIEYKERVVVSCASKDKLKEVKSVCSVGCIGCGVCAKLCKSGAIKMENNLPVFDAELCTSCGICIEKCPVKILSVWGDKAI